MSANRQAGYDPAVGSIDGSEDLLPSSSGRQYASAKTSQVLPLHEEATPFTLGSSGVFSTDEALARLDAASARAEAEVGSEASLWKIWPAVIGGAIVLTLFGTWASLALLSEKSQPIAPTAQAGVTEVENTLPFVLVSFHDRATMSEITRSLQVHGVEIESGPLPGGVYRVSIPAEDGTTYDAIAAGLDKDPLVGRLVIGRRPPD